VVKKPHNTVGRCRSRLVRYDAVHPFAESTPRSGHLNVALSGPGLVGLARMGSLLGDNKKLNLEVFTKERNAIDWLRTGSLPSQGA